MHKPKVLITGATGKTGSAAALQLLSLGYPVRALITCQDARSERLRQAGAEFVVGSLEDPVELETSMRGIQRAYFCPPLKPGSLRRATLFAAAAQQAKLEVVVALSQWLTDARHPAVHAREKWLSGLVFDWMPGVDVVTINPGWFADNYMVALEAIAQFGLLAMPLGEGLNAPPSNEDIARVIVGAITNPAPYVGKSLRPTGPTLLAPQEIADVFASVLGRRVKYQNAPLGLFLKVAKSMGLSNFVISQLYWFLLDYQRNSFGVGAPTDVVRQVGGSAAEGFEQIVRRYVGNSRAVQRTVTAKMRAIRNLAKGLLTPAPNLGDYARDCELPDLRNAALAADSPSWLLSHDPASSLGPTGI